MLMTQTSHNANIYASENLRNPAKDFLVASRQNSHMSKMINTFDPDSEIVDDNRNYLRAWIKFRKTTQAKLAAELGTSESVVSDLANGNRQLSPKWLRRISAILGTTPGFLLDNDPKDLDTAMLERVLALSEAGKAKTIKFIDDFLSDSDKRSGTHG